MIKKLITITVTRELKKKYEFTSGAWNYGGAYEHLVFKEIPGHAVLSTFSVRDLHSFVNRSPYMSRALRLDALSADNRAFQKVILPSFKADNVRLDSNVISAIAKLAEFMGLDAFSKAEHLAHFWTTVIQGWGLQLDYKDPEEWVQLAAKFARDLGDAGGYILPSRDSRRLELAFLEGVNWASSRVFNTRYATDSEALIRKKDKEALAIGVADPVGLLSEEGVPSRAVRMSLQTYRHRGAARIEVGGSGRAVAVTGRSLREAVGIEIVDDESEDDEIRYD